MREHQGVRRSDGGFGGRVRVPCDQHWSGVPRRKGQFVGIPLVSAHFPLVAGLNFLFGQARSRSLSL